MWVCERGQRRLELRAAWREQQSYRSTPRAFTLPCALRVCCVAASSMGPPTWAARCRHCCRRCYWTIRCCREACAGGWEVFWDGIEEREGEDKWRRNERITWWKMRGRNRAENGSSEGIRGEKEESKKEGNGIKRGKVERSRCENKKGNTWKMGISKRMKGEDRTEESKTENRANKKIKCEGMRREDNK